jgi:F-type H+-transporting ATPase subunit b
MDVTLLTFAATAAGQEQNLFTALGIDWRMMLEKGLAFLLLVIVLAKFVYPPLMRAVDGRREQIELGLREAKESQEALARAEAKASEVIAEARKEADEILARTQQDANTLLAEAEEKAKARAEQIVADAHTQLEADVRKAREALKAETVELVAAATEKVVDEKLDTRKDAQLITKILEGRA